MDAGPLIFKMAEKLAEMDGIVALGIKTPSFDVYVAYNRKAIAMMQIITDADWLRFYMPGTIISLPGF